MAAITENINLDIASAKEVNEKLLEKGASSEKEPEISSYPFWFSKRFTILILLFSGFFCAAVVSVCINLAVVEMTVNKTINKGNDTIQKPADFNWNSATVGLVLSSHSYGFLFSAFGGYLSVKFGGSITYGVSLMFLSLITFFNPMSLGLNFYLFLAFRAIGGVFDGFAYSSSAELFSRWIPINERSTFMAIIFGGVYIGIAVAYPFCGYVAYFWGWKMIFYITGTVFFIWSIIWLLVVKNQPSKDHRMSEKELKYILSKTETTPRKDIVHPYRKIFTSPAVWAMGVARFAYVWAYSITNTTLPLYVKDVTQREINEIGIISSLPNLFCIFMIPVAGILMDYLQNNHNLKPSQIHKSLMTFGFMTSSILFGVTSFSSNFTLSMTCFILIKIFLSFNFLILPLICLCLAPKHSSVLLGLSATWYLMCQVFVPALVGFVVVSHVRTEFFKILIENNEANFNQVNSFFSPSLAEWKICFMFSAGVLFIGAIIYIMYGSSELQPWATTESIHDAKCEESIKKNNRT